MRWWVKAIIGIIAVCLLLLMIIGIFNGIQRFILNVDLNTVEEDPMFAPTAEIVTRPPEITEATVDPNHPTLDDYVAEESSPVDKTAAELAREAEAAAE